MSNAPALKCPVCQQPLLRAESLSKGFVLKGRCPNVACRRRFTVVDYHNRLTDSYELRVVTTRGDRQKDQADEINISDLDTHPVPKVLTLIERLDEANDCYVRAHDDEIEALRVYYTKRHNAERLKLEQAKRIKDAASDALKGPKLGKLAKDAPDVGNLSPELNLLRKTLLIQLPKFVLKGKLTQDKADELVRKSHMPNGVRDLAEALGVPTWFE